MRLRQRAAGSVRWYLGAALLVAVASALFVQLLVPPLVGLADNKTYDEVMAQVGLTHAEDDTRYFDHVQLDYAVGEDRASGDVQRGSTQVLIVRVALALDALLTDPNWFDLRALGALHGLLLLVALAILAFGLFVGRWILNVVAFVGVAIVVSDAAYVAYLNSFYTWPVALIGLVTLLAGAALMARAETRVIGSVLAGFGGVGLVGANGDVSVLALPLAFLFVAAAWLGTTAPRRLASLGTAVAILVVGLWSYAEVPNRIRDVEHYNVVFANLASEAEDPAALLAEFGLPAEAHVLAGTNYYSAVTAAEEPGLRERVARDIDDVALMRYYVRHPSVLFEQLTQHARSALTVRPEFLGTTTADRAGPRTNDTGMTVWSTVRRSLPRKWWFVAAVTTAGLVVSVSDARSRRSPDRVVYCTPGLLGILSVAAMLAYAKPILFGSSVDLALRSPAFNLTFDLVLIGLVAVLAGRLSNPESQHMSGSLVARNVFDRKSQENVRLAYSLARRSIFGRYRETVFGVAWSVVYPLMMLAVYAFVFSQVFNARWDVETGNDVSFAVVLFSGLILFNFFSESTNNSAHIVANSSQLIKRTSVESVVLPLSVVIAALLTMALSSVPFLVGYLVTVGVPPASALLFPIVFLPLAIMSYGIALLVSAVSVYIRDIQQIAMVFTTTVLFMSPIFYPESAIPERFHGVVKFSPLWVPLIESKKILFWGQAPNWSSLLLYTLVGLVILIIGGAVFRRAQGGFADVL